MFIRTSSSLAESLKNYVEELKQWRGQTRQQGHTSEWVSWGKRVGCVKNSDSRGERKPSTRNVDTSQLSVRVLE
ncbi:hypothetical protein Tco_0198085, partial [Tanacetum coccineum]